MNFRSYLIFLVLFITNIYGFSNNTVISLIYDGIGINVGKTETDLINIHGKPGSVEKKTVKNPYTELNDIISIYHYKTFNCYYYENIDPNNHWTKLTQISIKSPEIKLNYGLKIGMKESEIIKILDKPTTSQKDLDITKHFYAPVLPFDNKHFPAEHEQLMLVYKNHILIEFAWLDWPSMS